MLMITRKMKYILATVLLCLGVGARAENIVMISSTEGAPGEEVTISIGLQNSDAVSSLQVSIPLNENLSLVEGSGLLGSRCGNHQLTVGVKDGVLNVFVYSMSMDNISGNSGEVASFKLKLGNQPLSATLAPSKLVLTNSSSNPVNASSQSGTVTIRCAKAQYSTTEIDFGAVPIRETYQRTATVTNIGNVDLKITSLLFSDVMTFSSSTALPLTIGAGESRDINITYQPTERGSITKSLKVECNSSSKLNTIQLKAQPFAVNELHVQPASGVSDEEVTVSMTMNNMDAISGLQLEFTLPEQLQYVDNSFALSNRKQDHNAVVSLNGNVLRIIAYSGNDKPFIGEDGEIGSFKVKLVGRYGVTLTPTKTVLSATINNKVENVVSQVYGGEITIQSPTISCDDALDFGAVAVTETCEKTFTINNDGSAPLTINRIVFNHENLSIKESLPIVIPASNSSNVTVVYSSEEQNAFEAKMQIYCNDPDLRLKEVTVRGSRFAPNYLTVRANDIFPHENLTVDLGLNTYDPIMGIQFDLVYPGQYYEAFDNNYTIESRAEGMTVDTRQIDNNTLRVFCYFLSGNGIAAGNSKVMSMMLKPKFDDVPQGSYNLTIKDIIFSAANLTDKYAGTDSNNSFTVLAEPLVTITAKNASRPYGSDNPTLEYEATGGTLLGEPELTCDATSTSNVGSYNIVVAKGTIRNKNINLVNGKLTITAKVVEAPNIVLSETSYVYDGNAKKPTVTVMDGGTTIPTTEYSVSYSNNTNVGTATVSITDVEGGNYAVSGSKTFAISSADGSLTPPAGKTNLVYSGVAQDLITAGTSTTGIVQYSLDGTTYATTIPKGTDAGSYTVYYRVKGDANHMDIAAQNFQVNIAAKTVESPTITLSQTSYTYDGNAKEPTVTVKDGEAIIPTTEYSVSYANNINVGTATVTISDAEGGNYTVSGSATFAISSADGSLTPPTGKGDLIYNGLAQDLITAGSSTTGTVQYSLDGTTYTTTIPQGTDAGSYTVYYKVKGDANHSDVAAQNFSVTISPKTVESPTITLSQTSYTYDGTAKEPTVTVMDGGTAISSTEYSVSYTNNINVGTATVTITDVEGGNYAVSGSKTFAISSADGSLTPPIGKTNLVYNGAAQDLITAGSSTTGTVQYSLDGTTYTTTIPQGTNAGSYTVYYKVEGDANHNGIAAQNFSVTIAPKTVENPSITLSETSYTYDGNAKEPIVTVKDGETTIPATEYSVSYANNINVGTATVTITDVEGGNYMVSGSTTFAISSADGCLTPPTGKSDLVYNGSAQELINAGSTTTGTMEYSLDGTTYAATIPQGTNAGSYTVYYRVKGDANHNDIAAQNFSVTIASKTVESPTITLGQTSYTYDGNAKEPTVTVMDGGTAISSTEYSVSYTNNINVGTATVTITDVEGGNYAVSGSKTFAISSADGSLTPPAGKTNLVYNGAAQDLITAGTSTTGTVQYSLDGTTYTTTLPQGTDVGSYTVYYRVKGDANHNDVAAQNFSVTIASKTVENPTITLSQTSYTYDGTAKEPAVTVMDGGTTISSTEYSVSYTNNTNVGTATVTIADKEGGNYTVSGSKTFAISSADGSLTPPAGKTNLIYNGTAQDLITAGTSTTGTVQYSLDGTTYTTTIPQGTNAGSYTVYYRVKGDANHNDIAAQNFSVTIASKTVVSPNITLSETSYTYDGNAKEPTVTVKDGETTIPATEYSVSYTNNTNVGTATVTITDVEGGDYTVSGSKTFTISSADGSLTPPTGKSDLVYNGTTQKLIVAGSSTTGIMEYSLDGTTYATTIPQGTNAGSYTVYYRVKGDANHNDIAAQNFSVTIASKTVENPTITLSQTSYTYDGTAKEPAVTVMDGGTTISSTEYSVSYTNNTNVGTATVTIADKEGGNYTVSGSKTFAISSADGSLTPPAGKTNLIYNGTAQDLITAGTSTTGTVQYSLDGTTYTTTIPQGTNAGSYTVYYRVKGDANHNDIAAQNFSVTIASKTVDNPSITLSETSYTYDGNAKEPTVTVKDGETTIPVAEYSVGYTNNTNVGTATVTITDKEGGNYTVCGSATFAISSADGSLTPPTGKSDLVYNGTAQDLITAGSSTTGTMKYSLDGTTYVTTIPQGTDAGSYTVYYKVEGDANHADVAAQNFQVTIAAKTVDSPTITLSETSYTYDGKAKEPTVTVKDGEATIPEAEYSVSYTNNTNVGTATVTITDKEGGNYKVSGSTTFVISSADGSLTPPSGKSDLVYNGSAQNLINAGSTSTGTLEYSLDGTTYATTIPQGTNAGTYTVYYRVKGDANHSDVAAQNFSVTIAKATLSVSVGDYEMTEGERIPSFTISYDGFVNNETVAVLTTVPTASCNATSESKPGEYSITISGGVATNYSFDYKSGTLTIKEKETFVAGGDDNKEEDDPATYKINTQEGVTTPTVAITDDTNVSGGFAIPETVEHNGVTYMVTEIGEGAFENNKELTDVSIPSSITAIGDKAFKNCSNLKSITVYITTPISFSVAAARRMMTRSDGSSIFDGVDKATCILYVPEGSVDLYKAAPVWCEFKSILAIGSTGIKDVLMTDGETHDVYNLQGRKVKAKATSLEGLPPGVYIVNGKKTILK